MNPGWCLLAPLLALGACSVLHDELPNDPPTVHLARMTCQSPGEASLDTLINSADAICRVSRGGEVRFEVRAADEDDDPVFYEWRSPSGGSFRDAQAQETNSWFAPQTIAGSSEQFVVQVLITDRNCNALIVPDIADRQRCAEDAQVLIENFLVEVVQREPMLEVTPDATSAFSAPQLVIDAFGSDPDGDRLEYHWESVVGQDSLSIWSEAIRDEETGRQIGSRAVVVAFFPGSYTLRVSASDGAANAEREISLHIPIEPPLPAGGMVRLVISATGQAYEIDAYEYPNAKGERPQSTSFFQAASLCAADGKRLCSPSEWSTACQAGQMRSFSSTDDFTTYDNSDHFGVRFCNVLGSAFSQQLNNDPAPSGSFPNCGGTTGVFDLTGNMDEWLAAIDDAGDLAVYVSASSVFASGACDGATLVTTLPIKGQDPYDIESLAETFTDSVLENYGHPLLGFRCCR